MSDHIVFFDDKCPFCHQAIRQILEVDAEKKIVFAPLDGITAEDLLTGPQQKLKGAHSLVLVENYNSTERIFWARAHAMFRVYWLSGNGWGLVGALSFLPRWFGDYFYTQFGSHRHQYHLYFSERPGPSDRFLP